MKLNINEIRISPNSNNFTLSRFSYVYQNGDKVLLYHALTQKKLLIKLSVWSKITKEYLLNPSLKGNQNKTFSLLLQYGFLIDTNNNFDNGLLEQIRNVNSPQKQELWFYVTDICSNSCSYCRQRLGMVNKKLKLNRTQALKTLEIFLSQVDFDRNISIVFYGGEPLLNFEIIRTVIDELHIKKLVNKVELNLFTNGQYVNDEILKYLSKTRIKVIFSVDGPELLNNKFRKNNFNKNTFKNIEESFSKFIKYGLIPGISLVIHSGNAKLLKESILYLKEKFSPINIYPNIMHLVKDEYNETYISDRYSAVAIIESFDFFASIGFPIENVLRKLRCFVNERVKLAECGACGNRLVLFPDGQIGPCEGSFHIDELRIPVQQMFNENSVFKQWKNRSPFYINKCLSCPAIGICGGGCPLDPYETRNDLFELDQRYCSFANETLNYFINKIFLNVGLTGDYYLIRPTDLKFLYGKIIDDSDDQPFRAGSRFGEFELSSYPKVSSNLD